MPIRGADVVRRPVLLRRFVKNKRTILHLRVFCHARTPWGQKFHQFRRRYGIAPRVRFAVASRKILIPRGGEGGKGHGRKCSPPSVHVRLFFLSLFFFFSLFDFEFPARIRKRGGGRPTEPPINAATATVLLGGGDK